MASAICNELASCAGTNFSSICGERRIVIGGGRRANDRSSRGEALPHVAAEDVQAAFVKVQRIDNPRCADHSDEEILIARWFLVVVGG